MTWICWRGIELSARVQQFLLAAEIAVLALFAVVASGYGRLFGEDHPETQAVVAGERLSFDFDPPPI